MPLWMEKFISAKMIIVGILARVFLIISIWKVLLILPWLHVMDSYLEIVSTIMTKTVATDVLINWHSEKARYKTDYYILGTYLSAIILILIITIICYHYAKHRSKQKGIDALTIKKWKILSLKMYVLKIVCVIISMT